MIDELQIRQTAKVVALMALLFLIYKFVDKQGLVVVINQGLPAEEAGVLRGILLGDKTGMSWEFYEQLKRVGLVHLVVASGSNVMLLGRSWVENLAKYWGRRAVILTLFIIVWSYTAMVGWEAPILRAAIMISIYYYAQILGRKYNWIRALLAAVGLMWLIDVSFINSISFWLSLAAFGAIATMPDSNRASKGRRKPGRWLAADLRSAWRVNWWIMPILAFSFGEISLVSPLANMLVLLIVEAVTIAGALGAMAGLAIPVLGQAMLWLIYPLLRHLIIVTNWLGGAGWATLKLNFNLFLLLGWYLVLAYLLVKERRR